MTLQEALNSGKPFKRLGGGFFISNEGELEWTTEDVLATDWLLKPDAVSKTITDLEFAEAWDTVRSRFLNVKSSEDSRLFQDLKRELFGE